MGEKARERVKRENSRGRLKGRDSETAAERIKF